MVFGEKQKKIENFSIFFNIKFVFFIKNYANILTTRVLALNLITNFLTKIYLPIQNDIKYCFFKPLIHSAYQKKILYLSFFN